MIEEGLEMGGIIVACLAPLYLRDRWERSSHRPGSSAGPDTDTPLEETHDVRSR